MEAGSWRLIAAAQNRRRPAGNRRIDPSRVEWTVILDHQRNEKDCHKESVVAKKLSANQKTNRTLNRTTGETGAAKKSTSRKKTTGAPFSEQDPKRRLGNFGGAGEHPRQGGRTSGIVGQSKQRNKTDK
jgi:hypothetical protein